MSTASGTSYTTTSNADHSQRRRRRHSSTDDTDDKTNHLANVDWEAEHTSSSHNNYLAYLDLEAKQTARVNNQKQHHALMDSIDQHCLLDVEFDQVKYMIKYTMNKRVFYMFV